jgi:ribosome recycling factor
MFDPTESMSEARFAMEHAVDHLIQEMTRVRTGKASGAMIENVQVEYYGSMTTISAVASISAADSRTLTIQPWEKNMIAPIERALLEANLGMTPQNDGQLIRLSVPPLTEERRKEMVKKSRGMGEDSKVGVRAARRDANDACRKAVKDGFPEDIGKRFESDIDALTKQFIDRIDKLVEAKEKEVLTV